MATQTNRLLSHLDEQCIPYQTIHHRLDYTAQRTAADTHTPGREFAKVVILRIGSRYAMVVLPAHHKVDFSRGRDLLRAPVRLANEEEIAQLFPDCEIGAEPPFGNLYGLPVYVSPDLTRDEFITFNGGTHHDAVRMRYEDYQRSVNPVVMDLAWQR